MRKLWCWLFGHKYKTYFIPKPGSGTYPYIPLDACMRCNEQDDWAKMVQSMAEFDRIVEIGRQGLNENFKKAQKPDALA